MSFLVILVLLLLPENQKNLFFRLKFLFCWQMKSFDLQNILQIRNYSSCSQDAKNFNISKNLTKHRQFEYSQIIKYLQYLQYQIKIDVQKRDFETQKKQNHKNSLLNWQKHKEMLIFKRKKISKAIVDALIGCNVPIKKLDQSFFRNK